MAVAAVAASTKFFLQCRVRDLKKTGGREGGREDGLPASDDTLHVDEVIT